MASCAKKRIRDAGNIPAWLYGLAKQLVEIETSRFVNERFADIAPLVKYSRNDLSKSINDKMAELRNEHLDKGQMYPADVLSTIAKLASILKKKDGTWLRNKALPVIIGHLGMQFDETVSILEPVDPEERDLGEQPFVHLVENMLLEISLQDSDWMKANAEYVLALHQSLHDWRSYYDRNKKKVLFSSMARFPTCCRNHAWPKSLKRV